MKKLFRIAMVGAVVLGAQSMVFASGANAEEVKIDTTKSTNTIQATEGEYKIDVVLDVKAFETVPAIEAMKVEEGVKEEVEAVQSVDSMQREMTEEEKAADFAKVKEICEALNIKYDENTVVDQLFGTLTDAQFEKLVDLGIIQVMEATSIEATAVELMDGQK